MDADNESRQGVLTAAKYTLAVVKAKLSAVRNLRIKGPAVAAAKTHCPDC